MGNSESLLPLKSESKFKVRHVWLVSFKEGHPFKDPKKAQELVDENFTVTFKKFRLK